MQITNNPIPKYEGGLRLLRQFVEFALAVGPHHLTHANLGLPEGSWAQIRFSIQQQSYKCYGVQRQP